MSYSGYAIEALVKVSEENHFALMEAKRARVDRIAQPRSGRRPAASGARRPAPSSPALSNQQQLPTFGQTNGTQQTQSGGAFTFGQSQQISASASFPPFGNNNGKSSNFTPPSSSFSFGTQLSSNPFAPSATFGNNDNNKSDQATAQVQYSPGNNLFLQSSEVIQADAASAGLSPSVAAPHLGGFAFTKSSSFSEFESASPAGLSTPPQKPLLRLNPPKDSMARKRPAVDEYDDDGYPVKPAGPGKPTASELADRTATPPPPVPVKGRPIVFFDSAPPSKPGTYGRSSRTPGLSPPRRPEHPQPLVLKNTTTPSKPGTFGSNRRSIPSPAARIHMFISEDPNADAMDTEVTSAAPIPSAPVTQNVFGGFGNASPSTSGMFESSNKFQVPQGSPQNFLSPLPSGSAIQMPFHDADEMNLDLSKLFKPLEDLKDWKTAFFAVEAEVQNADAMDTEDAAAHDPARNPSQSQPSPQDAPNMFANLGKPLTSTFPFGQQNASTESQQVSSPAFNWGQQATPASTQPQQTSTPSFTWGQRATPASSQPQQNATSAFNWGQQITFASTQPQQNSTSAFAFGQPSTTTQAQESSDSDAMMISPEKNPLGRSLFDRIEQPPMDATSSPATAGPAPPPTFSFGQNASSLGGLFGERPAAASTPTTSTPSGPGDLLGRVTAPVPSSFGQHTNGEFSQLNDSPRASSPTKEGRKMAEPKMHVEDKPSQDNLFSSLFVPKEQSASSSSTTASSPFAPKPQVNAASTADVPSSGGLFGSLTNKNGQDAANPFKSLNQEIASTSNNSSNVNHVISSQTGSNLFGAQTQATNKTGILNPFKSSTEEDTSRDVRSPLQPSSTAQNNGGNHAGPASKPANAVNQAADANEQSTRVGRKPGQPPSPPEHWTAEEKKQYNTAYRLKQLDVGAEAKRQALISARHTHRIKRLKEFYRKTERNIKAADGGPVRLASPSRHASDSEQNEIDSVWPPISRGSRKRTINSERSDLGTSSKRSHDDPGNHYFESAAPVAPGKRKVDDHVSPQQGRNESGKRARVAQAEQVSYPSFTTTEPNSNTSSMFKNILDKPAITTNGESTNESAASPSKLPEPGSKVPMQSTNDKDSALHPASNPFATSIAKWQAGATNTPNGITKPRDSSQIDAPTTKPANASSGLFVFKPVTTDIDTSSTSDSATVKPPTFGNSGGPTNFLAQFGQRSADDSKKEMEKRKAEDMDSDEDEAEWERRDAEEQRAKKHKMEQEASKLRPRFVPGKGFVFEAVGNENEKPAASSEVPASASHVNELDKQHEEYAKQQAAAANFANPFAKFLKQDSGNEGSKNGDADDEEEGSDEEEEQAPKKPTGGGLFDRISAPSSKANDDADKDHPLKASGEGVNMFGHISGAAASVPSFIAINQTALPAKTNPFGRLSSSTPSQNVFGTPTSARTLNAPSSGEKGDNTWNPENPIKFGVSPDAASKKRAREDDNDETERGQGKAKKTDVKDAPAVNIISPSPSKAPSGSLFGVAKPNAPPETPSKTFSNPTAPTPAGSIGSSFGFGISPIKPAPALGSLFPPSSNASNGVSRSTSPGATTGESATESNADGEDEAVEKHEQLNLTSGGPGEEDEDIIYEVRAKANIWDENKENEEGEKKGGWETKGLGPFRIMKNRETSKARMLMRSDPSGRIIINSSISKQFKYDAPTKSTFRIPTLSSNHKIETWVVKIGKDSDATEIARMLEENKDQN